MKDAIRRTVVMMLAVFMLAVSACSYAGLASHNGKIYVARNDMLLFGALRAVYACTEQGDKLQCKKVGAP